jgi:stage V sporulation protein AE
MERSGEMDYLKTFLVGGAICAVVQIFMDKTKLMPGRIMTGLVVLGAILGFLGWYEPFIEWAGSGASVPLLGFGNTLFKGVKEAIAEKGALGIFTGGLTASAAGITAALVFGYISALLFKPKIQE